MDIDRPQQNRINFLLPKLKEVLLRPEFRIIFLCLAWFVLSRATTEQQFFPSFLVFCIALLQFRLSSLKGHTKIPAIIENFGVIWYVFGIALSLFAGLYNGFTIELLPDDQLVLIPAAEYFLLKQLLHFLFAADYFPLLYIWLSTFCVALFDWSFLLSPEEEDNTSELKKKRLRQKKKKYKK